MALNKIVIMGRLVKDPEMRRFQSGSAVTSFSLVVQRDYKNKETGKYDVDFINCVAFGKTAEYVNQHYMKGAMAIVIGRLQVRSYTDSDGLKRYITEVVTDNVYHGEAYRQNKETEDNAAGQNWQDIEGPISEGTLPF